MQNAKEGTNEDFEKYYHEQELKEQLAIKQDLEVLEIIRKKLLRSKYGVYKSKINAVVEYNKITMREIKEDEFDREDFNKLKQWLEENENELGK